MIQEIINQAMQDIQKKQEDLIKNRLREIIGYDIDVEAESQRIFPRLAIRQINNETTYYWNDNGVPKEIITFIQEPIDFGNIENCKLTATVSYR